MIIIERIFDIQTGKETITERDETKEETASRLEFEVKAKTNQEAETLKQIQKAELLTKLGITEEEAKLLLS